MLSTVHITCLPLSDFQLNCACVADKHVDETLEFNFRSFPLSLKPIKIEPVTELSGLAHFVKFAQPITNQICQIWRGKSDNRIFLMLQWASGSISQGRNRGGRSWGARDLPPFCKHFLTKQPTTGDGNAMTIWWVPCTPHFNLTQCDAPPPLKNPCYLSHFKTIKHLLDLRILYNR